MRNIRCQRGSRCPGCSTCREFSEFRGCVPGVLLGSTVTLDANPWDRELFIKAIDGWFAEDPPNGELVEIEMLNMNILVVQRVGRIVFVLEHRPFSWTF